MHFDSKVKLISEVLRSRKKFVIPIYQREYSWERREVKSFAQDILNSLNIDLQSKKVVYQEYFLGNILLIGDFNNPKDNVINIVDGQQRMITITIFLAVLRDILLEMGEKDLAKLISDYIIGQDDDGEDFRIIEHEYNVNFFESFIQKKLEESTVAEPETEEEDRMFSAYKVIKKEISSYLKNNEIDSVDLVRGIRGQILNSTIITNVTKDEEFGSKLFEILNAKGRDLTTVDLIKNVIFDSGDSDNEANDYIEKWNGIKQILNKDSRVNFSVFYRHFWVANFSKSTEQMLYSDFIKDIKNKEYGYKRFIDEMTEFAKTYQFILSREFNQNRKDRFLNFLHNKFNNIQVRMLTAQLYRNYSNGLIEEKDFERIIVRICLFSFCHSSWGALRPSLLESDYSRIAIDLSNASTKEENIVIMNDMMTFFRKNLPNKRILEDKLDKVMNLYIKNKVNYRAIFIVEILMYAGFFEEKMKLDPYWFSDAQFSESTITNVRIFEGKIQTEENTSLQIEKLVDFFYNFTLKALNYKIGE